MKSTTFLAIFYGVSLAQNSIIGTPTVGQKLTRDRKTVVQVERPNSLTGSAEIVVVIGISFCVSTVCRSADEAMGTILYRGDFDPQYYEANRPPYQNFTVTVPNSIATGNAQINIAHVALVGSWSDPYTPLFRLGSRRIHYDQVHILSCLLKKHTMGQHPAMVPSISSGFIVGRSSGSLGYERIR
ncbi:unnamed protein product [Penicillium palitans]